MSNTYLKKVVGYAPEYHLDRLRKISSSRRISMARLIAIAIDNELQNEVPFEFDTTCTNEDHLDNTYAEECDRMLTFINTLNVGAGLDVLMLLRFKMKIPDKTVFLAVLNELLDKGLVEAFKPYRRTNMMPYPEDYMYYRSVGNDPKVKKKLSKEAKEFQRYQRLKKKFEKEES